jgi:beta-lactamase superfamily II metal-dependent hydrolase
MYNAGFGDCFLLTFPGPDRNRKVLIDCGKHMLCGAGPKLSRVVDQVLEDIKEGGEYRVDVVVATHRHRDHVEGFSIRQETWKEVTVSEVWMPWTEHPTDPRAREICEKQSTKAARLHAGIAALALDAADQEYLLGYAGNNLNNTKAMNLLHLGFKGGPVRRFLPEEDEGRNRFSPAVLPGVDVTVLGPPRNADVLAQMDPPEDESFLAAIRAQVAAEGKRPRAFGPQWELDRATYDQRIGGGLDDVFEQSSEAHLGELHDDATLEAAARLEEAVNSTSLVLLFRAGQALMLFPGDAQWGTWKSILCDSDKCKLLEDLTFYKVGHHGSHNATPVSFASQYIKSTVRTMIPYGLVAKWPTIPRQGLIDYFTKQSVQFVRSDQAPAAGAPFSACMDGGDVLYIDTELAIS